MSSTHIQIPQKPTKGPKREWKLSNLLDPWYKQSVFLGWSLIVASVFVIQLTMFFLYLYFGDESFIASFIQVSEWMGVGILTLGGVILSLKFLISALDKFGIL